MAAIGTALPPTEQPSVVDPHERVANLSSIDEKALPPHQHQHHHGDNKPAQEIEDSGELYDPNVYEGAFRHEVLPTDTRSTPRSDPFPVDPNAAEEPHQLTIRALVIGGILGGIGK
jgi:hypothetical protein